MNVFFHGTIEAGFDVLKAKIASDVAGPMSAHITEYRLADLGNGEVMCAMNCTNMEEMGKFMSSPEEMQWDKDNGAVYKAYFMEEMKDQVIWLSTCLKGGALQVRRLLPAHRLEFRIFSLTSGY